MNNSADVSRKAEDAYPTGASVPFFPVFSEVRVVHTGLDSTITVFIAWGYDVFSTSGQILFLHFGVGLIATFSTLIVYSLQTRSSDCRMAWNLLVPNYSDFLTKWRP